MYKVIFLNLMVNVLFWSVISAAFIGPGTVTSAAKAGASFGFSLIWALVFSVLATAILQETSARLAIVSKKSPGEMISILFNERMAFFVKFFIAFSIGFGCTAYQTGNIVGAVSGFGLIYNQEGVVVFLCFVSLIVAILFLGTQSKISYFLGLMVAIMGFSFIAILDFDNIDFFSFLKAVITPSFPPGSEMLITSLIGTTIVPYNIFLGFYLARSQGVKEMRLGLIPAVLIGGLISASILLLGVGMVGEFSFEKFAGMLTNSLGGFGKPFLGLGLLFAGFSSALASPLAAQLTAQSLFPYFKFNWVWIVVVLAGGFFGIIGGSPIYVILTAQAINGFLLPIVVIFLLIGINDVRIVGEGKTNSIVANIFLFGIVGLGLFIGIKNIEKAIGYSFPLAFYAIIISVIISLVLKKVLAKH